MQNERKNKGKIIIGLVGTLGAGKSTIAGYLETFGFKTFKLSEVIRKEFKNRILKRSELQDKGDKLRERHGTNYLAKKTLEEIKKMGVKKAVVDGVRNLGEFNFFASESNFYLISVDAPPRVRYERLKVRKSEADPKNWDGFISMEKRDLGEDVPYGQQTKKVMERADLRIINTELEKLPKKIDEILEALQKK